MPLYDRFLQRDAEPRVLPWLGGDRVFAADRTFRIGEAPAEHGWYRWTGEGRSLRCDGPAEPPLDLKGRRTIRGYVVGHALVPDEAAVAAEAIGRAIGQAVRLHLLDPDLPRFARVAAVEWYDGSLVFAQQEFGLGSEDEVQQAYEDRLDSVAAVTGVTPALDLAFRWETLRRAQTEQRRARIEAERQRREAERQRVEAEQEARERARLLARRRQEDFGEAAEHALRIAGAELLDWRAMDRHGNEAQVSFRFEGRRYRCICDRASMRIVDAGVCLTDESSGERGDDRFTLESLPAVLHWLNSGYRDGWRG
jgi:hypothetical protein